MPKKQSRSFHIEFKTEQQKQAWALFRENDVLFLSGPAGTGKSYLAIAFAVNEVLQNRCKRIVLTRPIVEAGEKLGYLPGELEEKVGPYMAPLYDCLNKLLDKDGPQYEQVKSAIETIPLAVMRGRTLDNAVCIFDEAQNADLSQFILYLSRLGEGGKMIVAGDPNQADIEGSALKDTIEKLRDIEGVAVVDFDEGDIVRHPLVAQMLDKLSS